VALWQPIIAKYSPTLVGECEKASAWASETARSWLMSGMLADKKNPSAGADRIVKGLSDHAETKSHARHISMTMASKLGLRIEALEKDNGLQDDVLSVHHACILTLSSTAAVKIVQNNIGNAFIQQVVQQTK
jgi:hypothetical protein